MSRLLAVHAHPDDEASKGAPTISKYAESGHELFLVCATGGECGDILNPVMDRPEIRENLPAVRVKELETAIDAIGYTHLDWLGYEDSGMADSEENANPACFAKADFDEAVGRLVKLIRQHRPHVIVTYSDNQTYRHPDHLMVHDISGPAFDRAADESWYPELGEPWQVQKMYYTLWSRARLVAHHEAILRLGLESPYGPEWFERDFDDHRITTKIDITGHYKARSAGLLAHATQVDPNEKFWFGLPDNEAERVYPFDDYILARSIIEGETVGSGTVGSDTAETFESDLFAGVSDD